MTDPDDLAAYWAEAVEAVIATAYADGCTCNATVVLHPHDGYDELRLLHHEWCPRLERLGQRTR